MPEEPELTDAEYAEAAAVWNAMTQADRSELLLLALRIGELLDERKPAAGAES